MISRVDSWEACPSPKLPIYMSLAKVAYLRTPSYAGFSLDGVAHHDEGTEAGDVVRWLFRIQWRPCGRRSGGNGRQKRQGHSSTDSRHGPTQAPCSVTRLSTLRLSDEPVDPCLWVHRHCRSFRLGTAINWWKSTGRGIRSETF